MAVALEDGLSDDEIARATGVPRSTVQRWRTKRLPAAAAPGDTFVAVPVAYPINRVKANGAVYQYPRYYFTNYSRDIRELFHSHCALLGVHATQSNFKTMSVASRASVEILDALVGPKS